MQLLEKEWFVRMVDQQSGTAAGRLVAVFSVAEQWISTPGNREQVKDVPSITENLKDYLTRTAISAGASNPARLTAQLLMLLQGAIAEELRNPEAHALQHAAAAAQVVVARACQTGRKKRLVQWSAAASIVVGAMAALLWQAYIPAPKVLTVAYEPDETFMRTAVPMPGGVNPSLMAATFTLQKKVDHGICPAPHLLNLPPNQVTAYMNVISYRTPENPAVDRANLDAFLTWYEQTLARECYYPPIPRATVILR
ncbi:MAG: hypothetical protein CVU26_02240 [Betaproteobacteria bacterium HGW-Betaproteobacteria-2]|nr:MAG: hypothetical protein CVU26_02240 [Betaproteobacteria bacterium HGW-Betaproteobacteria-2]